MSNKTTMKPIAVALGAVFVASLAGTSIANAAGNPFGMSELSSGYMVADSKEGKCGGADKSKMKKEGKCGGADKSKMKKEGKCGGADKAKMKKEGKCGGADKSKMKKEGKCGEGKCGGKK